MYPFIEAGMTKQYAPREKELIKETVARCQQIILGHKVQKFFNMPPSQERSDALALLRKELSKACEQIKPPDIDCVICRLDSIEMFDGDNLPDFDLYFSDTKGKQHRFKVGVKELELLRQIAGEDNIYDLTYKVTFDNEKLISIQRAK